MAKTGDPCPQDGCTGRLVVGPSFKTGERDEYQTQYLRCNLCRKHDGSKIVKPADEIRRRPRACLSPIFAPV